MNTSAVHLSYSCQAGCPELDVLDEAKFTGDQIRNFCILL